MPEHMRTYEASGLKFIVEYREFGTDRGPAIRIFGKLGDKEAQVLRFDCFEKDPHYHYDPSGFDGQHHLDRAVVPDVVAWALVMIRDNCKIMVKTAGYPDLAAELDQRAIAELVPELRRAIDQVSMEAKAAA